MDVDKVVPLQMDRFAVTRRLGAGSFGVVYEAYDRHRAATVALKRLYEFGPDTLRRFKREFRTLADVSHPNLVTLHELFGEGDEWFFTMELVPGTDFLSHVRPADLDVARLRSALRQLVQGVAALHAAGKVHRDLKPMNVRVRPDGRVVVLDFGLVTELASDPSIDVTRAGIVGSPAYMAPEQAAEGSLTEAADWYSVGAMLYEALTGQLPFSGTVLAVLVDKQMSDPPSAQTLAAGVPDDLSALCARLLSRSPQERPSGPDLLRELGGAEESRAARWTRDPASIMPFVGRAAELTVLEEAFAVVRAGRVAAVFVTGESGIGKTALVRHFLTGLEAGRDTVVLSGRCYERESVPYKAMDPLIDTLTRMLTHLPRPEAEALLPRDAATLARVFPVLAEVADLVAAPDRTVPLDRQELRRRAFGALRDLLARLAARGPVVLFIDDLQWGDADSARMLLEVLRPPDPPALLLLACYRTEDVASSPVLRALLERPADSDVAFESRVVTVGPLPLPDARDLAHRLLAAEAAGRDGVDQQALALIDREAGGSPFFVGELVRYLGAAGADVDSGERPPPSLDAVLRERLTRLPDPARELLEVVAVAGAPLARSAALAAAALTPGDIAPLTLLAAQHLVRARPMNGDERVETYHDRIRHAVVTALTPDRVRRAHRALAEALERLHPEEHEALAVHWQDAGEPVRAAEHAEVAAGLAADALAFDRAARWYRLTIDQRGPAGGSAPALHARLGEALANAGRGAEAAEAYFRAASDAPPAAAPEYRRRATEELLKAGYVERGLDALRGLSSEVGIELRRTPRGAVAMLAVRRVLQRLRGFRFRVRAGTSVPDADLARLDTMWTASVGLAVVDSIHAAALHARHLRLALRVGDLQRVARALAVEMGYALLGGSRRYRDRVTRAAEDLARRADSPYVFGLLRLARALMAYHGGQFRESIALADEADSLFQERCTGVSWETSFAHILRLRGLWHMGRIGELATRGRALVQRADDRGDRWTATMMGAFVAWNAGLALSDDPVAAERELDERMRLWPSDQYYLPWFWAGHGGVHIALYAGDVRRASARLESEWRRLERSQYLRVRWFHVLSLDLRARCALADAAAGGGERPLARAASDAARLERLNLPAVRALGSLIRAGICVVRRDGAGALAGLTAAEEGFRTAEMGLHAAVARRRRGELLGGDAGRSLTAEADAWMAGEGVRSPGRMTGVLAPFTPAG